MTYGGQRTVRETWLGIPSIGKILATLGEFLGLLNKGSATAQAAPSPSEVAQLQPVSSNALNVTRVGGLAALISGAGGAALVLFNVDKAKDRASIVVAAYVSVGVIVAAALLAAAIIIMADIRARAAIAVAVSPTARANARLQSITAVTVDPPQDTVVSLDQTYDLVLADATAANMILTLPTADSVPWQPMTIRREDDTGNYLIIRPQNAEKISGLPEFSLSRANFIQIYSDGKKWLAIR
jgi:hypothetical protein